jgi:CxxC motif-containing protein
MKELTCIVCPRGCRLSVNEENFSISGNACPRGAEYGRAETQNPVRTLTTTVPVEGGVLHRCPVKTAAPIPKKFLFDAMAALADIKLRAPVALGQTVLPGVFGTDVPVVSSREIPAGQEGQAKTHHK